jgi:hypothetical protein
MTLQDIIDIYNEGQEDKYTLTIDNYIRIDGLCEISIERLLIGKDYNFITTLLQSTKFTDAFWEWMKERHMAYYSEEYNQWMIRADNIVMIFPTPQMLTGYIIEYIQEML